MRKNKTEKMYFAGFWRPLSAFLAGCLMIIVLSGNYTEAAVAYAGSGSHFAPGLYVSAAKVVDSEEPSAPSGLVSIYVTCTSISIGWAKAADNVGVKGYHVYRNGKKLVSTTSLSYTNTGLVPGKAYSYSVRAYDAAGNISDYSTTVRITTKSDSLPPTTPGKPLATSVGLSSVDLEWEPSTDNIDIKRYEVYCNDKKAGSTSSTYLTCKNLVPGTTYDFYIKALDVSGNYSSPGGTLSVTMSKDSRPPTAPSGLAATSVTETGAVLNWSPSSDNVKVKGYEVLCNGVKKGSLSKTTYKCSGLTPGTSYVYSVRAYDNAGNASGYSTVNIKTVKDVKAPEAPVNLEYELNDTSVTLEWEASTDDVKVKTYYIYKNGIKIAETAKITRNVKVSSGIGVYLFMIKAVDLAGNVSEGSNTVLVITV